VDWAPFVVKDLVELILRLIILLTTRGAIHSTDSVVKFALMHGIPLVAGASTVVVTPPIVVIVLTWEAAAFLLLFICPALHHVS
jgi:hypothetical protein